jgi:hypothetical protein
MVHRTGRLLPLFLLTVLAALRSAPAAGPDLTGGWEVVIDLQGQKVDYRLDLSQKGEAVTGELLSPRSGNRYPVREGSLRDSTLRLLIPREIAGRKVVLTVAAKVVGEKWERLEGTYQAEGLGSGKLSGVRKRSPAAAATPGKPSPVGKWKGSASVPGEREIQSLLEIVEREGKLSGTAAGERGSLDFKSVSLGADGALVLTFNLLRGDGEREYVIRAAFEGPDLLRGRWSAADGSSGGAWSARREPPAPPPAGPALRPRYRLLAQLPGGKTAELDLRPRIEGEKLAGTLTTSRGKRAQILSGSYRGGRIELEADLVDEGEARRVKITGVSGERGFFQGTWATEDSTGTWSGRPVEEL